MNKIKWRSYWAIMNIQGKCLELFTNKASALEALELYEAYKTGFVVRQVLIRTI